jgi:hypothetical protein
VLLAAGLLAKKAVERGLTVNRRVKTSLAPGSRVVTDYLTKAGLLPYLAKLGFDVAAYGCTTCIGNAGDLRPSFNEAIAANDLVCAAVLSGNRNFEARIHPNLKANFLASPPLVVAYAIAGTVLKDFSAVGRRGRGRAAGHAEGPVAVVLNRGSDALRSRAGHFAGSTATSRARTRWKDVTVRAAVRLAALDSSRARRSSTASR